MEIVRIDLKKGNLSEDLALDSSAWRNRIHVVKLDNALMTMTMILL